MPLAPAKFGSQEFFEKTAFYGSQGRGLFTIPKLPPIVPQPPSSSTGTTFKSGTGESVYVELAKELLKSGLVAKTVSSPSSTLATFEEFSYIGPTRKHPHTQIFGPITVEFYLMGKDPEEAQSLYHTFLLWHEYIAGPRFDSTNTSPRSDSTYYAIEYYDQYVADAEFAVYSPQDPTKAIIHNKYYELYPRSVGGIQTSWESQDAPLTLSVEFEFYYMQSQLAKP
jgi:hypothetical protein